MTEDIMPTLEISVERRCYKIVVSAESWPEVLAHARVAEMKMRIAEVACRETTYDFTEDRWRIVIPEHVGIIRNRIALALLLVFPERVLREHLSTLSSVRMGSPYNYLTKPELDIQPHIDENGEGLRLNARGYKWASGILESIMGKNGSQEDGEDD